MRNAKILFIFVLFYFCAACNIPPVSLSPLSLLGQHQHDERLWGDWYFQDKTGISFLHIWKKNDNMVYIVIVLSGFYSNDRSIIYCKGFPTSIEERKFMNISQCKARLYTGDNPNEFLPHDHYLHVFYEISDEGKLIIKFMSRDYIEESIRSGQLVGAVAEDVYRSGKEPNLIITDGIASLVKFIENSRMDDLFFCDEFGCKNSFQKIPNPPPPNPE